MKPGSVSFVLKLVGLVTSMFLFDSCENKNKSFVRLKAKKEIVQEEPSRDTAGLRQQILAEERKATEFEVLPGLVVEAHTIGTYQAGDQQNYTVYTIFKKVKSAEGYHGQSHILFAGLRDSVDYNVEMPENLPVKFSGRKMEFPDGKKIGFEGFGKEFCTPGGCFEQSNLAPLTKVQLKKAL